MSIRGELEKLHRLLGGRRAFELETMSDADLLAEAGRMAATLRARRGIEGTFAAIPGKLGPPRDGVWAEVSDDELRARYEDAKRRCEAEQ
jgi:hypothetical protein